MAQQLPMNIAGPGWYRPARRVPMATTVHFGRIQRTDRVVLLGTGAGLSVGALALAC